VTSGTLLSIRRRLETCVVVVIHAVCGREPEHILTKIASPGQDLLLRLV
jgi:hypothetical protein